jgi:aspartokinase
MAAILEALEQFAEVEIVPDLATVSVIGRGLQEPGVSARILSALGDTRVRLVSQASDACFSVLVDTSEAPAVVRRLHADLVEERRQST